MVVTTVPHAQTLRFSPPVARRLIDSGLSVIVTGGGSWLGQATLAMLDDCFGDELPRRVHSFGSADRDLPLPSGRVARALALKSLADLAARPSIILHYAFLGKERTFDLDLAEFAARNAAIGDFVRDEARRLRPRGIFIPSSGAVYRPDRSVETDLACNPYGAMKARDEKKFLDLSNGDETRAVICRIFNLAGPFINKVNSYALSSILLDILRGGPIVLRSAKPVVRSYFHVGDLCDLAFALLLAETTYAEAPFDTAGNIAIEVGDLADRCRRLLGRADVQIERPDVPGDSQADRYVGDHATLTRLMSANELTAQPLDRQILDTSDYLATTLS